MSKKNHRKDTAKPNELRCKVCMWVRNDKYMQKQVQRQQDGRWTLWCPKCKKVQDFEPKPVDHNLQRKGIVSR